MNFRKSIPLIVLFILLIGSHLYFLARNIDRKYETTRLKIRLAELTSQNRQLAAQVAAAENLGEVEKLARGKLKMFYPEKINYIIVNEKPERSGRPPATSSAR